VKESDVRPEHYLRDYAAEFERRRWLVKRWPMIVKDLRAAADALEAQALSLVIPKKP
jgi:hypothetical protein